MVGEEAAKGAPLKTRTTMQPTRPLISHRQSVFGKGYRADTTHHMAHATHISPAPSECIPSPASRLGRQGQAHTLSIEPSPESLWRKDHTETVRQRSNPVFAREHVLTGNCSSGRVASRPEAP